MNPAISHDLPSGPLAHCQICGSKELDLILDLGHHSPCDSLLSQHQLREMERTYPLRFVRCLECGLVQIDYVVPREVLFYPEYPYRTGITESLSRNLQAMAAQLVKTLGVSAGKLAIDIGSNDGTALQGFKNMGLRVLGVEPTNIARIAIENGIPTIQKFFDEVLARDIRDEHGPASVIIATNIFAHVAGLGDLIRGVSELLIDGGMFVTESHYLLDLVDTLQYDSIYHEHLKYYSLRPLVTLMDSYDFTIVDVERIPNYGGSIRVFAKKGNSHPISPRLAALAEEEERRGLHDRRTYDQFREKVVRTKLDLQHLLLDLKRQGRRTIGIGCPGRASTLLNYCNIDPDLMPYIAEQSSSLKLGLYSPGKHIPIVDEKLMFEENPDYAVMLSWHYAAPIIRKLRQKGLKSRIIMPLPQVHVIEE